MPLQSVIADKASIPAGLETFYLEKDGKFVLEVEGMKTQADFDDYAKALKARFTDAATDFSKGNDGGLSREDIFNHIDKSFKSFAEGLTKPNGDGGDGGDGDTDPKILARLHDLERNAESSKDQIAKLTEERDEALGKSRDTTIRNTLSESAMKAGASADGVSNLVTLTESNFELTQDGQVVTKLVEGSGTPNQKPDDFFAAAARDKQFRMFWPASKGAGADNDGGGGGPGEGGDLGKGNPWSKAGWNMTAQGKMIRENRAEADRLMTAAGVKLGAVAPIR